jgi:hypothetical protein
MGLEVEVLIAFVDPCGAPEVVDRRRVDPHPRESDRQSFVERMQPPNVREDDDARCIGIDRRSTERAEAVPVGRVEDEALAARRPGASRDRRRRRASGRLVAHARLLVRGARLYPRWQDVEP